MIEVLRARGEGVEMDGLCVGAGQGEGAVEFGIAVCARGSDDEGEWGLVGWAGLGLHGGRIGSWSGAWCPRPVLEVVRCQKFLRSVRGSMVVAPGT